MGKFLKKQILFVKVGFITSIVILVVFCTVFAIGISTLLEAGQSINHTNRTLELILQAQTSTESAIHVGRRRVLGIQDVRLYDLRKSALSDIQILNDTVDEIESGLVENIRNKAIAKFNIQDVQINQSTSRIEPELLLQGSELSHEVDRAFNTIRYYELTTLAQKEQHRLGLQWKIVYLMITCLVLGIIVLFLTTNALLKELALRETVADYIRDRTDDGENMSQLRPREIARVLQIIEEGEEQLRSTFQIMFL